MKAFRLIGSDKPFALERTIMSAGCIPGVVGLSMDGKQRAIAAEADIIWLDDFRYQSCAAPDQLGRYAVYDCQAEDICHRAPAHKEAKTIALLLNIKHRLQEIG